MLRLVWATRSETNLGLPLHRREHPPRESSRAESDHDVEQAESGDGDIVSSGVKRSVEVRAVLGQESANDFGLARSSVGRNDSNQRRECLQYCC